MTASGLAHKAIAERYELIGEVGQGGMATVYLGQDLVLGREVAVKILHSHLAKDPEHRRRFRREARTTARLQHPNIVKIFDFAEQESQSAEGHESDKPVYLVMEFIKGHTLQEVVEQQEFPLCELAAALVEQIAEALEHAHQQQIIHRDLKPENVLIQEDGTVKLTDFGLARILDGESMTRTGTILGSPAYMAPEQIEGQTGDHRTDLFALGVMLYRLACQKHPFDLSNPMAILKAVGSGKFADPEQVRPGIGRDLARIIKRAMSLDPDKRYETIGEMRKVLQEYLAEAGIEEPAETLREYLLHREAALPKLEAQTILFLKASARRLMRQKRSSAALDRCNRVLAMDPHESDTHGLIRKLSQQERFGQLSLWAGAAAMLIGVVIGGWYFTQNQSITPGGSLHHRNAPRKASKFSKFSKASKRKKRPRRAKAPTRPRATKRPKARKRVAMLPPRRTLCRIAIPRGRGRYYDLLDFNLGFEIALRGSRRRPVLAIRLRKRRKKRAGLRLYRGPVLASIDSKRRFRLSYRRTRRIRMKRGQEHLLVFHFPRVKQRRHCEAFVPVIRVPQRPRPRPVDRDVQKDPPPAGPMRSVMIRIYPADARVLIENEHETQITGRILSRARSFSLKSGRTWKITLKRKWAKKSRWRVHVPMGNAPIKGFELDANGNVTRWVYLTYLPRFKMSALEVKFQPKTTVIKIGCNVPEALLIVGRGAHTQREGLQERVQPYALRRWSWNRWAKAMKRGVLLRVGAGNKHKVWRKEIPIQPGQTINIGIVKLKRLKPKVSKRRRK